MNKFLNIAVAIAISSFLAVNLYLLFGEKSVITKSVYVDKYERMTTGDFSVKLKKEGLVTPVETHTVYVGNENTVESWLVTEGDIIHAGDELAILNIERSENQNSVWASEQEILMQQEEEMENLISSLESDRSEANTSSTSSSNKRDNVQGSSEDTTVEVDLNVDVNISLDGSYAQAIAAAEQEVADIKRKLVVVTAQLAQNPSRPAIISPVDGVVSNVTRLGSTLAVELYSSQKVVTTYAQENEWEEVQEGVRVLIQGDVTKGITEGTVESISPMPAGDNKWLDAYKALGSSKVKNPLAYYEVRIALDSELESIPFGNNLNAILIVDEAKDAVSINESWLRNLEAGVAHGTVIDNSGRATEVTIGTPFNWKKRTVVTEGLQLGDVAIDGHSSFGYDYAPRVVLPMPSYFPKKHEWKSFGWKNYMKYMLVK